MMCIDILISDKKLYSHTGNILDRRSFGGGPDLTPLYIAEEDINHFHSVQKQMCDQFDPSFCPRFKKMAR
ncbi:hypothetical protein PVAP13_5NG648501 [Panicum virgatum]|uniref:Coproporphyrinogen oxidase n=1 Tax=Panicum virgatum TaxID=38727 RepID=A0A8T0SDU4_PANVG|nr:hypothetical protein PVAP13_5NG648501 [Panicum virgatum]